jgi:hypothetical protein
VQQCVCVCVCVRACVCARARGCVCVCACVCVTRSRQGVRDARNSSRVPTWPRLGQCRRRVPSGAMRAIPPPARMRASGHAVRRMLRSPRSEVCAGDRACVRRRVGPAVRSQVSSGPVPGSSCTCSRPLPHLHRDRAHICTGTGPPRAPARVLVRVRARPSDSDCGLPWPSRCSPAAHAAPQCNWMAPHSIDIQGSV